MPFKEACERFNLTPLALRQLIAAKFVRATGGREYANRMVSVADLSELAEQVPELLEAARMNRSIAGRDAEALRSRLLRIAAEKRGLLPLASQARKLGLTVAALRVAAKRWKLNLVRVGGRLYVVPDERWRAFVEARSLQRRQGVQKLDVALLARLRFATETEEEVREVQSSERVCGDRPSSEDAEP